MHLNARTYLSYNEQNYLCQIDFHFFKAKISYILRYTENYVLNQTITVCQKQYSSTVYVLYCFMIR